MLLLRIRIWCFLSLVKCHCDFTVIVTVYATVNVAKRTMVLFHTFHSALWIMYVFWTWFCAIQPCSASNPDFDLSRNKLTRLEVPKMPQIAFFFTGNNQILKFIFVRNQNIAQLELCWFVEKPHWQKDRLLYSLFQNFTRFSDNKKCPRHPEIPRACVTYYFLDQKVCCYLCVTDLVC